MKLVQLLAKELKEWPVKEGEYNKETDHCVQSDKTSQVFFCGSHGEIFLSERADETAGVRVTRSEWQAEREKMNEPKWIRHRGGNQPVDSGITVEYRMRDSGVSSRPELASDLRWDHRGSGVDIMAYRVIEEAKDQEIEEVKAIDTAKASTIEYAFGDKDSAPKDLDWKQLGTLTYKLEIDATEATKEIDSLVAKLGQIESPLKWRDEIIELEAYEEEFRREREKLIRKLESEGFKLIDHMAPVYGFSDIDFSDWRNWQAGDVIEIVANEAGHEFENGEEVIVSRLDINDIDMSVKAEYKDGSDYWWLSGKDAKFIRRP